MYGLQGATEKSTPATHGPVGDRGPRRPPSRHRDLRGLDGETTLSFDAMEDKFSPMLRPSHLALLVCSWLVACSGGSNDTTGDGDGDGGTSLAEAEATWGPAEGEWLLIEEATTGDCQAAIADLNFVPVTADDQRCLALEFDDYRGLPLMVGRACESGLDKYPASFELADDGRMLDMPLEYFQDGGVLESGTTYDCDFSRSQNELILVDGEPFIVFWVWDASLEGVMTCPEELPVDTEITCLKRIYRLAPAGSD